MAEISETAALARYFNTADDPAGYVKRPLPRFAEEIKALTPGERSELAQLAAVELGVTLKPVA